MLPGGQLLPICKSHCPPEGTIQSRMLAAGSHFDKQDSHIRGVKSTPSPSLVPVPGSERRRQEWGVG